MIDFSGYTREEIQKEMLKQVPSRIDTREGSVIQTAIGPAVWYLEGLYMVLDQIQQNAYARTAVGQFLEYIAEERGIHRKKATSAVRKGTFDTEVPEGSSFKTVNGANSVIFISGEMLSKTDGSYVYKMTCTTPGTAGNAYVGRMLPITAVSGLTSAEIGEIMLSGSEEEDDESLRNRYFATFEVAAFGGNLTSYRNTILAMEGVGAVQVYPAWKGGGTVLCSILNSQLKPADSGLIERVQNIICPAENEGDEPSPNGFGMAPIGASVTIATAKILILNISCKIQVVEGAAATTEIYQEQIEQKIRGYVESVCSTWGNPIKGQKIEYAVAVYISRIAVAILSIEEIVNVTDIQINGSGDDLILTETAQLQQIPELGVVTINGS